MATRKKWILSVGVVVLVLIVLGCGVTGFSVATPTSAPSRSVQAPTPTAAAPLVPPTVDEAEAANALEAQVIAVYEAAAPAVVNITSRRYGYDIFMRPVPQEGTGSGFVYDKEGHIVTNYHVVEGAEQLIVTFSGGGEYEAELIGQDAANDLAVIGVDAGDDLPEPLALADSDKLKVGQFVLAIGNPFGLEQTLTTGVVSALGRVIQSPEDNRFIGEAIQTDAAINPGNSGGPLLDLAGRVIGVNSQIISPSGASSGIGFAVSANTVRRVVPALISQGHYPHPWLGTEMLSLTPSTAKLFREAGMDIPTDSGLLVLDVVEGGPADKAGLKGGSRLLRIGSYRIPVGGDIITAINGEPIEDFQDLTVYLETQTAVGDTVELTIIRNGKERTISVTLGERPERR